MDPLAMVVIGGLITATLLTLPVLPAISVLVPGRTETSNRNWTDDVPDQPG